MGMIKKNQRMDQSSRCEIHLMILLNDPIHVKYLSYHLDHCSEKKLRFLTTMQEEKKNCLISSQYKTYIPFQLKSISFNLISSSQLSSNPLQKADIPISPIVESPIASVVKDELMMILQYLILHMHTGYQ